jgi:hypothetical protein
VVFAVSAAKLLKGAWMLPEVGLVEELRIPHVLTAHEPVSELVE